MNIICNVLFVITLFFFVLKEYGIIQMYHYELDKYFYHIKNNRKNYYYLWYFLLGVFLLKFNLLYIGLCIILLSYLIRDYKIKYTSRIKRMLVINFILISFFLLTNTLKYVFILPFLYLLLLHCCCLGAEKIVYLHFLKKAKRKLRDKYVIGITGSCGKTSVKNIIYDLMINDYSVSKTPKSYNTKMGIIKSINDYIRNKDEYFICEYGVDKVGGMDKLLRIASPNIAIITDVGNQHLLSFKSIDNILNEKIKIINSLNSKGIGIINNDNDKLRNYNYGNKTIIRYGINHDSDVRGKNIVLTSEYSQFDLYIKDKYITQVKTCLLSRHAIENVLCGISLCLAIEMPIKSIISNIKNILPLEHRLEKKYIDGVEVIDDGFNSNEKGFLEALELLSTSHKYKVLITPGIIEQGKNSQNISYTIAKGIIENVDYVYLVSDNTKYIQEYFNNHKFNKYSVCDRFITAFSEAKKIQQEKIILIENDLPDIYLK